MLAVVWLDALLCWQRLHHQRQAANQSHSSESPQTPPQRTPTPEPPASSRLQTPAPLHAESFARLGITLSDKPCIGFIKPITFAKSREQLTSLCHHSNLQPMYNVLNQKKAFHWCKEDNEDWKRSIFIKENNEEIFLTRHMLKLLKMWSLLMNYVDKIRID